MVSPLAHNEPIGNISALTDDIICTANIKSNIIENLFIYSYFINNTYYSLDTALKINVLAN